MSDYRYQITKHNDIACLHVLIDGNEMVQTYIPIDDIQASIKQVATPPASEHRGVMFVTDLPRIFPEITIEATDTQGHLRDTGVFETLRNRLLLPESYTIRGIFMYSNKREWAIQIESPDFPDANNFNWNDIEYPCIEPTYCKTLDETTGQYEPHLVEIKVHAQHIVPVTDGHRFLLRSTMEQVSKLTGGTFKEKMSETAEEDK